jgi:hypothetical protein
MRMNASAATFRGCSPLARAMLRPPRRSPKACRRKSTSRAMAAR